MGGDVDCVFADSLFFVAEEFLLGQGEEFGFFFDFMEF